MNSVAMGVDDDVCDVVDVCEGVLVMDGVRGRKQEA